MVLSHLVAPGEMRDGGEASCEEHDHVEPHHVELATQRVGRDVRDDPPDGGHGAAVEQPARGDEEDGLHVDLEHSNSPD